MKKVWFLMFKYIGKITSGVYNVVVSWIYLYIDTTVCTLILHSLYINTAVVH
jgi:hypothetical protein